MPVQFKQVEKSDLPKIKVIYDWYILNSTATFHTEPINIEELGDMIFIEHPVYCSYLIYLETSLVGYCYLTNYKKRQAYNRTAEITVYLSPEYCGKGIGNEVLLFLENQAIQVGLKNLIGIISGNNRGSITLFEKSGYSRCAHFRNVGEKFGEILDVVAFQKEI